MARGINITKTTRKYMCDISGCGNKTNYLITKRQSMAGKPLRLCDDCIRSMYHLIADDAPEAVEPADVPVLPTAADEEPEGEKTVYPAEEEKPARRSSGKGESKPNRARKGNR